MNLPNPIESIQKFARQASAHPVLSTKALLLYGAVLLGSLIAYEPSVLPLSDTMLGLNVANTAALLTYLAVGAVHDTYAEWRQGKAKNEELWLSPVYEIAYTAVKHQNRVVDAVEYILEGRFLGKQKNSPQVPARLLDEKPETSWVESVQSRHDDATQTILLPPKK
ncbi:MAG: hypothetical protein J0L97_07340 [Alphaproteobacteria bacterium]|nr:hypothetical protein [Alphaproteobacteria bacterium]